jgi:hypothetical protein
MAAEKGRGPAGDALASGCNVAPTQAQSRAVPRIVICTNCYMLQCKSLLSLLVSR